MASAQNILNNAGFEYGLMCYNDIIWSNTDKLGAGDYKLVMSPDAHSGSYSLEVSCNGKDCPKAAAMSNPIPTIPGQKYVLKLYAKCPDGAMATVYIPGTAEGDHSEPMYCTGRWERNTVSFKTSPTAHDFIFYLFSYGRSWARFDDVVLTYGGRTAPVPMTLHAGQRKVAISNQTLLVDGAPYLALGFFDVNDGDLAKVAATGANTIFGMGQHSANALCYSTVQTVFQDRAYDLGLNFVPESSSTVRLGVPSLMAGVAQKFAPHLANIAWMLADEPDQVLVPFWYTDPKVFLAAYDSLKTQTTLPVFADFQRAAWSAYTDVSPYVRGVDFFMAEPYGPDFQSVGYAVKMFKTLAPQHPIWMAQDDPDAKLIVPKAYWLILNGATGIAYFTWDTFKAQPAKAAAVQQVFKELGQLKTVVFSQNIDSLVTAPASLGFTARYERDSAYIFAVNPAAQNVDAIFQMKGLPAGQQIQVMFEDRTITASAGSFTDTFAGVARHVYVMRMPMPAIAQNDVRNGQPALPDRQ